MQSESYIDPKTGARVHRVLGRKGTLPPEPKTFRAPRMGNAPRFRSGTMAEVCLDARRYGLRSACVSYRSYETTHYPS
jgi:hypothetical protein